MVFTEPEWQFFADFGVKYDYNLLHFVDNLPKSAFLIRQQYCQIKVIISVLYVKVC
jgi:hypothetical protein